MRLLFLMVCLCAGLVPLISHGAPSSAVEEGFPGWPSTFQGRALNACPLSPAEESFYRAFPGRIGKFTDGERNIIIRWIARETRMLHSSSVCLKGAGYSVSPLPLFRDSNKALWEQYEAIRGDERLRIRERITDEQGGSWTDVSSWYWAAALGRSKGPWQAVTVVERVE